MKLYIQWATDPANDWQEIDSQDWAALAKKSVPPVDRTPIYDRDMAVIGFTGTDVVIDDQPGWINRVCVQGVTFFGDHIAVQHHPDRNYIDVYCWHDDLADYSPEQLRGSKWTFHPLQTDPILNTKQYCIQFIHSSLLDSAPAMETTGGIVQYRDYNELTLPDESLIRHGIWMPDAVNKRLRDFMPIGWRKWQ